jgi:hypothetical protein
MTRKTYRTAMGKTVDIGALQLQNENVRAVGNMKVNARGDLIDGWNRPIDHRTQQVQKQYAKQTTNVSDQPVVTSQPGAPVAKKDTPKKPKAPPAAAPSVQVEPAPAEAAKPAGLAEAIARARQVRQDPIQSVQQMAKNNPGVTKI